MTAMRTRAEDYPLGGNLPDLSFDLAGGLDGDRAASVNDHLRVVAGVTFGLAATQIAPDVLKYLSERDLGLSVLVVPREFTGVGQPMQHGLARARLGLYRSGSLVLNGSLPGRPTVGAAFVAAAQPEGGVMWRPTRAYGLEHV